MWISKHQEQFQSNGLEDQLEHRKVWVSATKSGVLKKGKIMETWNIFTKVGRLQDVDDTRKRAGNHRGRKAQEGRHT